MALIAAIGTKQRNTIFPQLLTRIVFNASWNIFSSSHVRPDALLIVSAFVGYVYPAYRTYQATRSTQDTISLTTWSRYWIVLAAVQAIMAISDSFFWWLPFYDEAKLILLIWLVFPTAQVKVLSKFIFRAQVKFMQPICYPI